jgi:serine protease AprX
MSDNVKLPIKVVPALERDFYIPEHLGGPKKVFGKVTRETRQQLASQVIGVRDHFKSAFREFPDVPAVARAKVRQEAIAKSHRPTTVLSSSTCPIIGAEGLGELLLSVTSAGLENLARRVEKDETKAGIANLSTLESFEAYQPRIEIPADHIAKVKLFRHHDPTLDEAIERSFRQVVRRFGIREPRELRYGRGLKIYRLPVNQEGLIESLENYIGTQSVGPFPIYHPVRSTAVTLRSLLPDEFPEPEPDIEYPVIGVIDSGTPANDPYLRPWRLAREVFVADHEQDNSHGTFVSGLIVHARKLNHHDDIFPSCSAKIVDVVALGKKGTTEDKLLSNLEQALEDHPDVKIWNLSLGTQRCIVDKTFSDLGVAIDRLQDEYGVSFVVAAGNYRNKPYRGWPPDDLGEDDRICAPADSVRAVIVGSVAHRDHSSSRVKAGEPSPFTRRGPGPLYLPKPEISHIGGNCNSLGNSSQIGVLSLDGRGNVAEDVGTSFATPLIATLLANISHRLNDTSRLLSRALLVHSAAVRGQKIDPLLLHYQGFGVPPDLDTILGCDPWQCTLIFELEIAPSVAYEKAVFPMPKCLYLNDDTVRANILMTLIHEPDLDAAFGSEYCRSNIDVSLGTYDPGKDGKRHQRKQVPEDPKLSGSRYEKDLVEHGFKWSPIKVYRREMVKGVRGETWRLDLSVHHRSGQPATDSQNAVLIITVADPQKMAPVYDEIVVQVNNLGWAATDLQIKSRLKV